MYIYKKILQPFRHVAVFIITKKIIYILWHHRINFIKYWIAWDFAAENSEVLFITFTANKRNDVNLMWWSHFAILCAKNHKIAVIWHILNISNVSVKRLINVIKCAKQILGDKVSNSVLCNFLNKLYRWRVEW